MRFIYIKKLNRTLVDEKKNTVAQMHILNLFLPLIEVGRREHQ